MNKSQIVTILFSIALVLVLYYGCERVPPDQKEIEQSRSLVVESTDPSVLIQKAKANVSSVENAQIGILEQELEASLTDSTKLPILERLSGKYYELGYPALSGYYAQRIAEIRNTEEAWSISGTTYSIALQRSEDDQIRTFLTGRAVQAFENAISLNPDNPANQVNLALVYTSNPPQENPMQGIQLLLDLNNRYPDNVYILNNLGRLAIQTGQFDRAIERLERAYDITPDNSNTICLLAKAYQSAGYIDKASQFDEQCQMQIQ